MSLLSHQVSLFYYKQIDLHDSNVIVFEDNVSVLCGEDRPLFREHPKTFFSYFFKQRLFQSFF